MTFSDTPLSPEVLLRRAAAGDAARAQQLLASVSSTKLLDAVVCQAELATDDDGFRRAGIDAIAELHRAAIEVMDLPQPSTVADEVEGGGPVAEFFLQAGQDVDDWPAWPHDDGFSAGGDAGGFEEPTLVGWELTTVAPTQLEAAALTLQARPWQLALVAFADRRDGRDTRVRRVVAAAADGRMLATQLRYQAATDAADVLDAVVTRDPTDLASDSALATGLLATLRRAAQRG